ncbi:hypothetical protein, partial [[Eubacterium] cellulosolvens]
DPDQYVKLGEPYRSPLLLKDVFLIVHELLFYRFYKNRKSGILFELDGRQIDQLELCQRMVIDRVRMTWVHNCDGRPPIDPSPVTFYRPNPRSIDYCSVSPCSGTSNP